MGGIFTNHMIKNKKELWGAANSLLPLYKISCRLHLRNIAIKRRENEQSRRRVGINFVIILQPPGMAGWTLNLGESRD